MQHPQLLVRTLRFFLGSDDRDDDEGDTDDEDEAMEVVAVAKDAFNIHHKNTAPSKKKVRNYERAVKRVKHNAKKERKNKTVHTSTALKLLHDPQVTIQHAMAAASSAAMSLTCVLCCLLCCCLHLCRSLLHCCC